MGFHRYIAHSGFFEGCPVQIRENDGTVTDGVMVAILTDTPQPTMIVEQGGIQRQVWLDQVSHPKQ